MSEIDRPPIHVPRALEGELRALALVTEVDVEEHVARALRLYLEREGRRSLVTGFAERARQRHRLALDFLVEPSRSAT